LEASLFCAQISCVFGFVPEGEHERAGVTIRGFAGEFVGFALSGAADGTCGHEFASLLLAQNDTCRFALPGMEMARAPVDLCASLAEDSKLKAENELSTCGKDL
jgi:hypothetical protein